MTRFALAALLALAASAPAAAQSGPPLAEALRDLAEARGLRLVYDGALVAGKRTACPVSVRRSDRPTAAVLACVLRGTGVEARRLPSGTVALYAAGAPRRSAPTAAPPTVSEEAHRAEIHTLSGFVRDARGEALVGAAVYAPALGRGATANAYGFYTLALPAGRHRVVASYVGHAPADTAVTLAADRRLDLALRPDPAALGEVVVEADEVEAGPPGSVRLTARDVERVPALLGEADPLKALQLSPAVRAGAEGTAGLHVRGGSPDQTLLLLDGAPVYNASHLAGAVSVFNSDALQSVHLVPGAAPARYGGRLSAVVDVSQREGSRERRTGTATVGLLASRALVEGPLAGGRGSFLVAGRRTYADALIRPLLWAQGDYAIGYAFSDASAKASLDLDSRTKVFASLYGGRDRFVNWSEETFDSQQVTERFSTGLSWGNVTATARATRILSPRAFASALVYVSRYGFSAEREASDTYPEGLGTDRVFEYRQSSGLTDLAARADLELALGAGHAAEVGAVVERRWFRPASTYRSLRVGDDVTEESVEDRVATVGGAAYVSDAVRVGPVRVEGGLRLGWLAVRDETFAALQPRLGVSAERGPWTLRASAGRSWQPLHLLSNAGVGLPTDLWVPATDRVGPASAWQAAVEAERPLGRGWTGSAGAFAKTMTGLVEYRDAAGFFTSSDRWEDDVTTGSGRAYGVEVAARRTGGRTDVQLAYALSRSTRTFAEIDGGRTFPYRYDRTHDLSLAVTRHLSARRRLTALVVGARGAAVTVPEARAGFGGVVYGRRNGHRFPTYARVDVSYEVDYGRGRLALGLYNATNRLNPFYLQFEPRGSGPLGDRPDGFTYRSLFPVLPSVSYRFGL
jgi:hypothetical protein